MIKKFNNFTWWLNLSQSSTVEDRDFTIARNVFYNNAKQIQTRRGYRTFWNQIWSDPITSYFFYQRDDNQVRNALCVAWSSMYRYDETTNTWSSIASNLIDFETLSTKSWKRTRWDFTVYKNVCYMCDWVNPYASFDSAYWQPWLGTAFVIWSFTHTTNLITKVAHWLSNWDEVLFTSTAILPTGIKAYQVYYVISVTVDTFKISTTYWGTELDFIDNWSGTSSYYKLIQPRFRYLQYLIDRVFWAWDDRNPITLYYTNAAPGWANTITTNAVVVWWDESWVINWLSEYSQSVLAFKSNKIYTVDVTNNKANAIDTQTWWYSDRTVHNVANWLVYFNERWIDTLKSRDWVSWTSAIESKTLSDKLRLLIKDILPSSYNASASWYIKPLDNYYRSFDSDWDDIPDKTLVYNSNVWAWTEYVYPNIYDYWQYQDVNGNKKYLFASASWWQMYEMEYGFDDAGVAIECELQTKKYDFWDPWSIKSFDFVDISWRKQEDWEIEVSVVVDDDNIWWWSITDSHINTNYAPVSLGTSTLWTEPLWASTVSWDEVPLYPFSIRVPFFARWSMIHVNLKSVWVQRIFDQMSISVQGEPINVINFSNIL